MTEKISMEELSDEDLFIYIACADTPADKVMANAAFAEIHRRYVKQLYARCRRMLKARPDGEAFAEELVQATLARAYDKADTYEAAPEGAAGASRTVAWLSKIALNLYRDFLRNPDRPGPLSVVELDVHAEQYSPEDFAAMFLEDQAQSFSAYHYQLVAEGFETLDERSKVVLIETLVQRGRSKGKTYMLKGTADDLAARLNTTTDNVRRIRMKAIRKINAYIEQRKAAENNNG